MKFLNITNIRVFYWMFGGSAYYLFVITKIFFHCFFCLFLLQCNFFPFWLRHQSSASYGAPPFTGNRFLVRISP